MLREEYAKNKICYLSVFLTFHICVMKIIHVYKQYYTRVYTIFQNYVSHGNIVFLLYLNKKRVNFHESTCLDNNILKVMRFDFNEKVFFYSFLTEKHGINNCDKNHTVSSMSCIIFQDKKMQIPTDRRHFWLSSSVNAVTHFSQTVTPSYIKDWQQKSNRYF